jgi:hypothetical protein
LIIHNELEYFNFNDLIRVLFKISLEKNRISYVYTDNIEVRNGNPELSMAIETLEQIMRGSSSKFIAKMIGVDEIDYTYENGYYDLYKAMKLFTCGIIWTQSNVGSSIHKSSSDKTKLIR